MQQTLSIFSIRHPWRFALPLAFCATLAACGGRSNDEWGDINYSRVRHVPENDSGYSLPSVLSCVDDDLINCR